MATFNRSSKNTPQTRVNHLITSPTIRVVDSQDEQLGILTIEEALRQAADQGLDLVEVAPNADPPVCRIMDYGQYKYQLSKKIHDAKKNQKIVLLKEIKLRPKTEEHDFQFKLKHAITFIEDGNKVKVTVMFRGRELSHKDMGEVLLQRFLAGAEPYAMVEIPPKMEGKTLTLVLAPKKK